MSGTGRDTISDGSAMALSKMGDFYMPAVFNTVFKIYRFYSTNSDWWGLGVRRFFPKNFMATG